MDRHSWLSESNSSVRSMMSIDSPSVRASTSKYARRFQDSQSQLAREQDTWTRTMDLENSVFGSSTLNSQSSITLLGDETLVEAPDQLAESCSTLLQQFLQGLVSVEKSENPFELANEFEEICNDHLKVFLTLNKRQNLDTTQTFTLPIGLDQMLRLERDTWRLSRILYEDRFKADASDDDMGVDEGIQSDREVVENIYDKNAVLRQMQLVIDWLEQNELDDLQQEEEEKNIEFFSEGPHYWENTLHLAKNKRNKFKLGGPAERRELCSEMDPDAPFRSGKPLEDLDKEDESRMVRYIFRYLRAGQLDTGKMLAQKLGFHWLSAALEGWSLHHDPKISGRLSAEEEEREVEGNAQRDLWKYVCWQSAKSPEVSVFEKAVFGALSANVAATLPVCPRWTDKLWAFLRASVDVQIERELSHSTTQKPVTARSAGSVSNSTRVSVDLPTDYWNNLRNNEEVFRDMEELLKDHQWTPEERCHSLIQKFIILNDVDSVLEVMANWVRAQKDFTDLVSPQILRFFAHLSLFLKSIDFVNTDIRVNFFITVLEAYIGYLVEKKHIQLIATYVATLPSNIQVSNYSKLLAKITDKSERATCLKLAKKAGLDVESVTKSVVETINVVSADDVRDGATPSDPLLANSLSVEVTPEDMAMIDSLEWLSLGQTQYIELMRQGNAMMRTFVLRGKTDAAKEVLTKRFPLDIVDGVQRAWKKKTGSNELSAELASLTREYLCFHAYFSAMSAFEHWVQYYYNSKPSEPVKPTSNRFTDKVAYDHMVKGYENELEHWKTALSGQAKLVADKIFNVLLFPDGGWMRDPEEAQTSANSPRTQQLEALRKQYIPQLTLLVHAVLHASNRLTDCVQIADVIASEFTMLYTNFTEEQLQDLLKKIRESSIAALNDGNDALGYPTGQ